MESTYLNLNLVLVLFVALCLIDGNLPTYLALSSRLLAIKLRGLPLRYSLRVRLWFDKLGHRRGPLGCLVKEYQLYRIRTNPAYREFFQDRD